MTPDQVERDIDAAGRRYHEWRDLEVLQTWRTVPVSSLPELSQSDETPGSGLTTLGGKDHG